MFPKSGEWCNFTSITEIENIPEKNQFESFGISKSQEISD